jgi:hypothetical protein
MGSRRRHQRRKARDEVQRLQHDVRGPVAVRSLQSVADLPLRREIEPLDGQILSLTFLTPTFCPAKTLLKLIF